MTDIRCMWGRGQHIISLFYISTFVDLERHWIGLRTSLDFDFNRTTTLRNKNSPAHAQAWE